MLKILYFDHIPNREAACVAFISQSPKEDYISLVTSYRMEGHQIPNVAMRWIVPGGKHRPSHPRHTWRRTVIKDLKIFNIADDEDEDGGILSPDMLLTMRGTNNRKKLIKVTSVVSSTVSQMKTPAFGGGGGNDFPLVTSTGGRNRLRQCRASHKTHQLLITNSSSSA